MRTMEIPDTGRATANQLNQSRGSSIACNAIIFCGDEIGELCPPILAAKAMPNCMRGQPAHRINKRDSKQPLTIKHGAKVVFGGNVLKIGYIKM